MTNYNLKISDFMEHFRLSHKLNPHYNLEHSIERDDGLNREERDTLILQCKLEGLI